MHIDKYLKTIVEWRFCPMSNYICTVAKETKNEANTPRGKALILSLIHKGMRDFDSSRVERMYQCCLCGLCKTCALDDTDIPGMVRAARADIIIERKAPESVLNVKQTIENKRPLFERPTQKKPSLEGVPKKEAEIVYFIDSTIASYFPEIARASIKILKSAGVDFLVAGETGYSGSIMYEMGFFDEAAKLAQENIEIFKTSGCKTVVFSSPHCYRFFVEQCQELGVSIPSNIKMLHISEYLYSLLEESRILLNNSLAKSVTYHDPCNLGRGRNVYDEPREIIKKVPGIDFQETRWKKDKANCCGGSGLKFTNPKIAKKVARRRIDEIMAHTDTEILVTACPFCKNGFNEVIESSDNIKVYDLVELVAAAL